MNEHEGSEEGGEGLAGLMRATWIAYVATGADTDGDQQWHCSPEWAGKALMHAVETLRKDYDDSLDESTAAESARDTALREKADMEARLAEVEALADESCHHCGRMPEADGDHSCPCPLSNSECLEHTANPVVSLTALRDAAAPPEHNFARLDSCPPASQGCMCACHLNPAIQHFAPCCTPALANPSAAQREAEVGARATVTFPAHHLVGMDLGMTCINCGNHTELSAPCIPARDYPLTTDEAEVPR